jgi:hypothetical protein
MHGIVEANQLAGEEFAVALQRFGDAARIIDRFDDDAGRLLSAIARSTFSFGSRLHTDGMTQDRRD